MTKFRATLIICAVIFSIAWQLLADRIVFVRLLVSSPERIALYLYDNRATLLIDTAHTVGIAVAGLLLAMLLGTALGLLGLRHRRAASLLEAGSTVAQAIPLIVFSPFLIMIFGVGFVSQMALASIMAIFPWIIGMIAAFRGTRSEFDELLTFYDVPFGDRITKVYFPHALPNLVASARVSAALAVLGAVIAEFTGSSIGLGRNIFMGTVRLEPELIMSALLRKR
jgi:ABC-type nitrate/sulfonate/bicarbonate transport system permease component